MLVHHLEEFVDMTTHDLTGRYTREDLELLGGEDIMRPRQRQASIVPDV